MADAAARALFTVPEAAWLRTLHGDARFVFRGAPQTLSVASALFGASSAPDIGRAVIQRGRAALTLGPDEQLYIVPERDAAAFTDQVASALGSQPHSLVDVSHRQVALELRGASAEWLLAVACPLPLDVAAFPVCGCTRTVFAKAEIVLLRTGADAFRIEVARSFARYVGDLLREAARDIPYRGDA